MTYPQASCLADLDRIIRERLDAGTLSVGPIAQWAHAWKVDSADTIYVQGQYRSRGWTQGVFNPKGSLIRWQCPARGNKGLFGKGLAEVFAPTTLPVVK